MGLSDEERAFVQDLHRVLSAPAADEQYNQLSGSFDGRVLNADLARTSAVDITIKKSRNCMPSKRRLSRHIEKQASTKKPFFKLSPKLKAERDQRRKLRELDVVENLRAVARRAAAVR